MSRRGFLAGTVVISAVAIFAMLTMVSWARESMPAFQEGKSEGDRVEKLLNDSDCHSCHSMDRKVVGPSYSDVAKRYAAQANAAGQLTRIIREGGTGNWGDVRMPAHSDLKDAQLVEMVQWILSLKDRTPGQEQEARAKDYTYTLNGRTITVDFPVFVEGTDQWVTKDVFRGYQLYNSYCYRCHGQDATESELAPDLRRFTGSGKTAQDFLPVVMAGREDKGMPGWAGFFSEEEVQQIYRYVKGRSLELIPVGRPRSEYDTNK